MSPADRARTHLIALSGDPEATTRLLDSFERAHPEIARRLIASPAGLQSLIAVFSNSRFLSEAVLQYPEWLEDIVTGGDIHRAVLSEELINKLEVLLSPAEPPSALTLALFRRRQLLRILLRDTFGLATLAEITEELSNVADAILEVSYRRIRADLVRRFGQPQPGSELSIIALGKLGGRELNYSSDIDLIFVYSGSGETDGQQRITTHEFFRKAANSLTRLLSTYTPQGLCYRVDLRLRPDGNVGELCSSVEGAKQYYSTRARDWELQMLIKARVAAGEHEPGRELLDSVEGKIYSSTLNFAAVEAVSLTRERIHEKLAARRITATGAIDVKLTRGGIRDIEFLVQCLQRLHGGREPWVRHGGTLMALGRLTDKSFISPAEYARLASAYQFLRHVEHRLQFLDDRQTHLLPTETAELTKLARRMPEGELARQANADTLLHSLNSHLEDVQEMYDRVIHSQQPLYYSAPDSDDSEQRRSDLLFEAPVITNLIRFLDQRAPGIAATIQKKPIRRAAARFEAFLEKVFDSPEYLQLLNDVPQLTEDIIEIFDNSPWYAEELIRRPSLIESVAQAREDRQPPYSALTDLLGTATDVRLFFRREMLRIQAASICGDAWIFDTLGLTSDLADAIINAVYTLAVREVLSTHPPENDTYRAFDQLQVIALGRLGMREFDLGSDADLNFVLPDEDAGEMLFWTRVAERIISTISAYTGEGTIFAVDTRLRPNGREGALVQTVSACCDYIAHRAEAWEGISWMKSRCVAGSTAKSTEFLHQLQEADWRRYGQSGRSRDDLREMRVRLEREQGASNPLKAGPGGFYDIDFALMYLRLKGAGIFFRVLNTPERIDIVEKMGHLGREDAIFLREAATLYRAIDHGLRLHSGHAAGKLPQSPAQLEVLSELVHRWMPADLHGKPLPEVLAEIQRRTRTYFRRLFS